MGSASCRSRALPCATPSTTSTSTTSASSLDAIQCAAVAPTLPAPTMLTFFRIFFSLLNRNVFLSSCAARLTSQWGRTSLERVPAKSVTQRLKPPLILLVLMPGLKPWPTGPGLPPYPICHGLTGPACWLHVADNPRGKLAGSHLRCAGGLALKVVRHELLQDRLLKRLRDQLGRFLPADEIQQHHARQDDRAGVDDVFIGVLGRGSM